MNKLYTALAVAALTLTALFSVAVVGAPDTPEQEVAVEFTAVEDVNSVQRPAHWGVTAPAYDVCAWTGVRDGVLVGAHYNELSEYYNFWYVDHYWVSCVARVAVNSFHCWIVSRHDGYTIHLGPC